MKKHFTMCLCLLLAAVFLLSLTACGAKAPEPKPDEEIKAWTRQGYYADENGNMASVTWMDLDSEAGWYVGQDSRLAAPLIYEPFTRGELGVLMPKGNEALLDYVNAFLKEE